MDLRLDDPDPRIRDLAYLLFVEELLGGQWVERWARKRGKLDALREWRKVARPTPCDAQAFTLGRGTRRPASGDDHAPRFPTPDTALPISGMAATTADRRAG